MTSGELIEKCAGSVHGQGSFDDPSFVRQFWCRAIQKEKVRLKSSIERRPLSLSKGSQLKLPLTYESCPSTVVSAPIETVWLLLTDPARWGDFFDLRITRVEPAGLAVIGQRFCGESGPRFLHIGLKFEYTEINESEHRLGLSVQLPFGITVREDLDCLPISRTTCRVNYHCNFGFIKGWRGAIIRAVVRRSLDTGPVDSLSRLKRAAEERYSNFQV
jgi:hypothetical protein